MKTKIIFLLVFISIFLTGCDDNDYNFDYISEAATTKLGKRLQENTDMVSVIYNDSTYTPTEGLEITEISYLSTDGLPMRIFIFEVDLLKSNINFTIGTPDDRTDFKLMQAPTKQAELVDREGNKIWGGTNADFADLKTFIPRGALHQRGVVVKTNFDTQYGPRGFFGVTDDKKAMIGEMEEYPEMTSDHNFPELVAGEVRLLKEGQIIQHASTEVHPRTMVGVAENQTTVYLVVVDGRRFSYSNGMTYAEQSKCMKALGAYDALNLDGGGSSVFFTRNTSGIEDNKFQIRNWPTDNGGQERETANSLLIVSNN